MASESWSAVSRLKKAVKKMTVLIKILTLSQSATSILGYYFRTRTRRFSFSNRQGLHECIDEDSESNGSGSVRALQRTRSCATDSDDDVDKRAEAFIANFRQQLWLERQVSLELQYCRVNSIASDKSDR